MKCLITYLLSMLTLAVNGQILDSFYAQWPQEITWLGDHSKFSRGSGKLQLDDTAATSSNSAELLTPVVFPDSLEWRSGCSLDFNPSTSNFARLIIFSDQPSFDDTPNALWWRVGGQSGSVDNLRLMQKTEGIDSLLWESREGSAASEPDFDIELSLKNGMAYINVDSASQPWIQDSFSFTGWSFKDGFSGYACRYSASRADKIVFDPIFLSPRLEDRSAPAIVKLDWAENGIVRCVFSEALLADSVRFSSVVDSFSWLSGNACLIYLSWNGSSTSLNISNMLDAWGNHSDTSIVFHPGIARRGEVLVTEIHPRPDSFMGSLPPSEFIEIHNASQNRISLKGWSIQDKADWEDERWRNFSWSYLDSGETAILCKREDSLHFARFGRVICPESFPYLNQSADWIILQNPLGEIIEKCRYSNRNFGADYRSDGGFSIERWLRYDCGLLTAFSVSDLPEGGSPGTVPPMQTPSFDTIPLKPRRTLWRSDSIIRLDWPLALDVDPIDADSSIAVVDLWNRKTWAKIEASNAGSLQLYIDSLQFCDGRTLRDFHLEIRPPTYPSPSQLIIHEVLSNPYSGKVDFLEIRNVSDSFLCLDGIMIAQNRDFLSWPYQDWVQIPRSGFFIAPDSVLVLCENCREAVSHYGNSDSFNCIPLDDFIKIPDQGSWLALLDSSVDLILIDSSSIREVFHHPLLRNEDGHSLQRYFPSIHGNQANQWFSTSQDMGGASPGKLNASAHSDIALSVRDSLFYTHPDWFSPASGVGGICKFVIQSKAAASTAFLEIYHSNGALVRTLLNNKLVGPVHEGFWNGLDNFGNLVSPGNYIFRLQLIQPDGRIFVRRSLIAVRY